MRKSNFALRLQPSLLDEARKLADAEDVALISSSTWQLRNKVSALRKQFKPQPDSGLADCGTEAGRVRPLQGRDLGVELRNVGDRRDNPVLTLVDPTASL
jgi:hypothetical protein